MCTGRRATEEAHPPAREGGWGIVVVVAAHLHLTIVVGLMRCAGVFYLTWKNEFGTSARETAAVQSILSSLTSFCGIIGGVLTKSFGCRCSGILGGLLMFVGLLGSFWVNSIFQLYVTAAIAGTGGGICLNSGVVAVAMYFKKNYKIAHGIAFSGSGTGNIVAPPILQLLLGSYGWRGAILITSAVVANGLVCCTLFRPSSNNKIPQLKSHPTIQVTKLDVHKACNGNSADFGNGSDGEDQQSTLGELEAISRARFDDDERNGYVSLKDSKRSRPSVSLLKRSLTSLGLDVMVKSYRFALLCLLQIEYIIPYMAFMQFIVPRAESIGVAPSSAALLLSILGVGGLVGTLGSGPLVSGKLSAENVIALCMALSGGALLITTVDSYISLAVASFTHGFAGGFFIAITVVLTRRYVGLGSFAVSLGLYNVFTGVGTLAGPVIAGWLLDVTSSYYIVFYVLSGMCFFCAAQMLLFPVLKRIERGVDINPSNR